MGREDRELPFVGRGDGKSQDLRGEGQYPLPRGDGQPPVKPGLSLPIPQSLGLGTGLFLEDNGTLGFGTESQRPLPPSAMAQSTHRRFGDSGNSGGPSIASGVHSICLCVLNLEGPRMSQGVGVMPLPSAAIVTPHPFDIPVAPALRSQPSPWPSVPSGASALSHPPRPTPCSCGH